ncbi:MAG: thioesterase [Proteobacteria bacterium]|nr:thioesterase [Pseudomonadota bacterium]
MKLNQTQEFIYKIQTSDLAKSLSTDPNDDFPEVFATSRMIALMELTAARLMKSELKEGELSVGVNVNVTHVAATPNNQEVTVVATFTGMKSKLYQFDVEMFDKGGKAGYGSHTRAIVKTARLLEGANQRVK